MLNIHTQILLNPFLTLSLTGNLRNAHHRVKGSAVTTGLFRVIFVKDQILFCLNPYIV